MTHAQSKNRTEKKSGSKNAVENYQGKKNGSKNYDKIGSKNCYLVLQDVC